MFYVPVFIALLAAILDARTGKIPNWLTLPSLVMAIAQHTLVEGLSGTLSSIVGALVCGLVPWMLFRGTQGEGIGGGDVKLFAALGAWLGALRGLEIELGSFVVLALLAVAQLTYRGQLGRVMLNVLTLLTNPFRSRERRKAIEPATMTEMRMGPAIFIATALGLSPVLG